MGAENRNSTSKIYYSTFGEFFVKRATKENPEAMRRTNKAGNDVYEIRYDTLVGHIDMIDIRTEEYEYGGKKMKTTRLYIDMHDNDDIFTLVLFATGAYSLQILPYLPSVNYMDDVMFTIWPYDNPYMAVMQKAGGAEWERVPRAIAKELVPEWKKVELNGQVAWDKSDALKFFKKKVEDIQKQIGQYGNTPKVKESPVESDEDNDLPF